MRNSRKSNEIRKPTVIINFCPAALGSVLYEAGNTRIICAVSVSNKVPDHAEDKGMGWLTADYSLLPYSTQPRVKKEFLTRSSRSVEIKRLIGRSIRGAVDLKKLNGFFLQIDCDVIQADGGTRTAAISASFIALKLAIKRMMDEKMLLENPIISNVAAISVGIVENELLLDLDYPEDSKADVDMNIVMNSKQELIEIQGTGEGKSFTFDQLNAMTSLASCGISELFAFQDSIV